MTLVHLIEQEISEGEVSAGRIHAAVKEKNESFVTEMNCVASVDVASEALAVTSRRLCGRKQWDVISQLSQERKMHTRLGNRFDSILGIQSIEMTIEYFNCN